MKDKKEEIEKNLKEKTDFLKRKNRKKFEKVEKVRQLFDNLRLDHFFNKSDL